MKGNPKTSRLIALVFFFAHLVSSGQDIEPRLLTNIPRGTNIAAISYGYASGSILYAKEIFPPPVNFHSHNLAVGYVRGFSLLGLGAKVKALVPLSASHWDAPWKGGDTVVDITGFADARIGVDVNLLGGPALSKAEYGSYKQKTLVSLGVLLSVPTGNYNPTSLLNLGSNLVSVQTTLGASYTHETWSFEALGRVQFFTENNRFLESQTLAQTPFYSGAVHVIKTLPNKWWAGLGVAYGYGSQTIRNGVALSARVSSLRYGAVLSAPLGKGKSLKLTVANLERFEQGAEVFLANVAYQVVF